VDLDLAINQPLSDPVEVAAYYVVAEALTNAAKHAQASEVAVSAHSRGARLHVSVRDNGVGGAQLGKGSGLIGLKDRLDTSAAPSDSSVRSEAGRRWTPPSRSTLAARRVSRQLMRKCRCQLYPLTPAPADVEQRHARPQTQLAQRHVDLCNLRLFERHVIPLEVRTTLGLGRVEEEPVEFVGQIVMRLHVLKLRCVS
jgi:hypothetical protein